MKNAWHCAGRWYTLMWLLSSNSFAQTPADSAQTQNPRAPAVYIDCDLCDGSDFDFIRTEVPFVNYARDRKDAALHILITTQSTGSGGAEFTLTFIGQKNFTGVNDTLRHVELPTDTEDITRQGKDISLYGSLSADRVTSSWKINLSLNGNYNENNFKIGDDTISSFSRGKNLYALTVKSLGAHWSAGVFASASASTFNNTALASNLSPALEYNLYPYVESTRRQLRFLYRAGCHFMRYEQETIYDKAQENLLKHSLDMALEVKQPWGSVAVALQGSNYFHAFDKNRLYLFSELSLQLFKGVSVRLFGSASLIHDQLFLPKGQASTEEILLRRRQLETPYDYFVSLGLGYTFGSIYNNVVNPRFGN